MRSIIKIFVVVQFLVTFLAQRALAQATSVVISGQTTVQAGVTYTYQGIFKNSSGQVVTPPVPLTDAWDWSYPTANLLNYGMYSIDVQWTVPGTYLIEYNLQSFTNSYSATLSVTVVASPPVAVPATNVTSTSFTANWNSVTGATSYRLDVARDINFTNLVAGYNDLSLSTTSRSVTGLQAGSTYFYRVRAITASGTTANSNTIAVLSAPVMLAATNVGATSFTTNWNAVTGATEYLVEIATNTSFSPLITSYFSWGTNYVIPSLTPATLYYCRVTARTSSSSSAYSNIIQTTTLPVAPQALVATNISATSSTANWNAVTGATGYRLDVSTDPGFATLITGYNNLSVTSTSQNVAGLAASTKYYYRVRAANISGSSANSNVITFTTTPAIPVATSASNITTTSFRANWNSTAGAVNYLVEVSKSNSFSILIGSYTSSSLNQVVGGLSPSTVYYYRIRAQSAVNNSGYSNVVQTATVPSPPIIVSPTILSSTSFIANWTSVVSTGYRIDIATDENFTKFFGNYNNYSLSANNITITGIAPGATYYYRVRATNPLGGASSNSGTMKIDAFAKNYVRTTVVLVPGKTTVTQAEAAPLGEQQTKYNFFDGLGRPNQSLAVQNSPLQKDVIQPIAYDAFGRVAKQYLPYTDGTTGWYKTDALKDPTTMATTEQDIYRSGRQYKFYQQASEIEHSDKPFSETVFEPSSLNRIVKQGSPGAAWQPDNISTYGSVDHTTKKSYESNLASEVLLWNYTEPTSTYPFGLVNAGASASWVYYGVNQLHKDKTKDAHGNEIIEYTDKEGHTVLKRVQVMPGSPMVNDINYASTYYIYDNFGSLVCVLPPEAVKLITASGSTAYFDQTDAVKDAFLKRWAFRYVYDGRRRMIQKQVPGAEPVYMVYDNRDRLVLTQDGNQRTGATNAIKYWTFTKYDELNRPIVTGIKDTTTNIQLTQAEMQNVVDTYYSLIATTKPWRKYSEKYIGAAARNVHGYSNYSYPVVTSAAVVDPFRYLTITYYDNYTFKSLWQDTYGYVTDGLTETVNGVTYTQPSIENLKIIGQVTGMKVKVLDGGVAGGSTWLKAVNYFDDKYRVIQTIGDNYKGGSDRASNLYDFTGKVLRTKSTHIENDILWKDLVGATFAGNYLKNTAASSVWGNSGAASVQSLPANQDGWVEFTASAGNVHLMVGLSAQNANANYTSIGYAIYLRNTGLVSIFEGGALKKDLGAYNAGDIFRIQRIGTAIKYFKNGLEIYPAGLSVTQTPSSSSLLVDVSIYTVGATVLDAKSSFSNSSHTISRHFLYDHAGRLKKIYHQVDAQPEVLLSSNEYNELGQLVDKGLHSVNNSTPMQSVDYRYNIRGWLTSINNSKLANDGATNNDAGDFFGMNLGYNEGFTDDTNTPTIVSGYTLDGNANDQSANTLNGTVVGAQLTTDSQGNTGKAYTFNGVNDYIKINGSEQKHSFVQNTGRFTIAAFVKIGDLTARNVIVGSGAASVNKGFFFLYEPAAQQFGDRQLRFSSYEGESGAYNQAVGSIATIHDNNWHHVAVVGDGQSIRFYVDGVQDGKATAITNFSDGPSTYPTMIGNAVDGSGTRILGMRGGIDEVFMFDRALNQTEIQKLAQRSAVSAALDNGQYNGNISAIKWSNQQGIGAIKEYGYNFTYDALNRLSTAIHSQFKQSGISENGLFHESGFQYDLNGNIMALQRTSELGLIDNLSYNYGTGATQSNKLLSVTDITVNATNKLKGFPDFNATGTDYTYDVNGNMTRDLNKGIGATLTDATNLITYNYLNLPETVTKSGNTIRYIYDATGRKLTQRVTTLLSVKQTDYSGEFVYEDDFLRFINHEEGRVVMSSEKLMYTHDGENATGLTALNTTLAPVTQNGEKYIRVTSNGAVTGSGIFPIGNTLDVIAGEKYLIRAKGYKTGANNVVIQLKSNAMSTVFYGSYLPGSVATESWMEHMFTVPVGTTQLQVGVGWGTVTTGQQFFLNEFEVIRLTSAAPEYQYNLKDHLGNVRLTFTSKLDVEAPKATFEDANVNAEQGQFLRYENARRVNHYLFDHTNGSSPTTVAGGAQRLSGQTNEVYGLARSISVMPGDVINMEVYAKYIDPNSSNWSAALNTLITQIASGTASTGTVIDGGSYASSTTAFPFPVDAAQNTSGSNEAGPKAFLSWLVYDRNYNLISSKSGFRQMSSAAKENGSDVAHELLSGSLTITEPGYVYVFLSNEQGTNPYEVYFDDFRVEQIKSPVIQTEDYYPFGLTFNSYRRENNLMNGYQYNGKENQDALDLNWLDYGARMYMADIARWGVVDPLTDLARRFSPYTYAYDNPIRFIDPDGMYSTEEWKRDNGVGDSDLTNVYKDYDSIEPPEEKTESTVTTEYNLSEAAAYFYSLPTGAFNTRSRRVNRVTQFKEQTKVNYKSNTTTINGKLKEYRYAEVLTTRTFISIELHPTGKIKSATHNSYTTKSHYKVETDENGKLLFTNEILDGTTFEKQRKVNPSDVDSFLRRELNKAIKYNDRGWDYNIDGVDVGPIIDPLEYSNEAEKTMNRLYEDD